MMLEPNIIPRLTFQESQAATGTLSVDLDRLVASRVLIQANSGGGKSHALRYLLEQTSGTLQQLVIDPEGEFASLRTRFPYILVGREGDIPAHPSSAHLLCRRLMELKVSAIIDLYDLLPSERRRFVRVFLEELIRLPRSFWHPLMLVLDEAHHFCPERGSGEAESTDAVIAACTLGRKRGFMPVLATQRIAKLHKDAAAELLNVLIGRTGLDVDVRRAGDILGFDKQQRQQLKYLEPGSFFAFGPAIARDVVQVRTGTVLTPHPEPGKIAPTIAPPPEQLRAVLAELKQIPLQAEEEVRGLERAQRRIAELEQQLQHTAQRARTEPVITQIKVPVLTKQHLDHVATIRTELEGVAKHLSAVVQRYQHLADEMVDAHQQIQPPSTPAPTAVDKTAVIPKGDDRHTSIDALLTIPAIAAKLKQAANNLEPTTAPYIYSTLRLLWTTALTPQEIAEGRGTASHRTIQRIQTATRVLQKLNFVVDEGHGRLRVNQDELYRLRALSQIMKGQQINTPSA